MRRTPRLCVVFGALLGACTTSSSSDDGPQPSTSDGSCGFEGDSDVEVPWSQLQDSLDENGQIIGSDCTALCGNQVFGDITGCSLVDEVPAETGSATTSGTGEPGDTGGEPGDTGTGESGDTGETGTGGDGDTGTGEGGDTGDGDTEGGDTEGGDTGGSDTGGEDTIGGPTSGGETMGTGGELMVTINCEYIEYCLGGRGHEALRSRPTGDGDDRLGRWLAAMAHSEAASVVAFRSLADELAAHGAPNELVQRARSAAMDEVDHARAMTRLAERRGVAVQEPRFDPLEIRDLTTIATENAVEGCVRETWAALEAAHQARTAADPELRRVMAGIAVDETRHAQFSHDLDRWLCNRLDGEARATVEAARRRAMEELHEGMQGEREPVLRDRAGLPEFATARRLFEGLRQQLWN